MLKTIKPADAPARKFANGSDLSAALRGDIEAAMLAVLASSDPSPLKRAFKAPAGAGKSRIVCELLARHGAALLQRGHVVVHLPTLELADQMAARFSDIGSGLPVLVLRGRSAVVEGEPLCTRSGIAQRLGGVAPSVRAALCEDEGPGGGDVVADCRQGCRWWDHLPAAYGGARVVFTSHAYLTLPLPLYGNVALRIVDETFWQALCGVHTMALESFLTAGPAPDCAMGALLIKARATVYEALMTGAGVMGALRRKRITPADLALFADMEEDAVPPPAVTPAMTEAQQIGLLDRFDLEAFRSARRRAAAWRALAETPARAETQRLTLARDAAAPATGAPRMAVSVHTVEALPEDAMIVIDADADSAILSAIAPGMTVCAYETPALAEVVQIADLTMSKQHLLDPKAGRERRDAVMRLLAGEVATAPNHRVLLVTNRSVLEALHDDAGTPREVPDRLRVQLQGADCRWFGPSIRGTDAFAGHDAVVVLGRHEQRAETIDGLMRCVWGVRKRKRMAFLDGEQHRIRADLVTRTAEGRTVMVASHPAPEGRAILAQLREATTAQAGARLRPIFPSGPKRILLLSSVPIPGLHLDRVVAFDDLVCSRLFAALEEARWAPLVLTAEGLAAGAPTVFGSLSAATNWLKRLGGVEALRLLLIDLAAQQGRGVTTAPWKPKGRRGKAPLRAAFSAQTASPTASP